MKKFVVASIAACAGAMISSAAVAQTNVAARYAGEFSGFYVGVNGGGMNFTTKGAFTLVPDEFWHTDRKEATIGGIHGGFQGQWGNLVAGIEGSWQGVLSNGYGSTDGGQCSLSAGFLCQARINDILSVGPRVGFAMNQFLVYGTGGYARAEIETRHLFTATNSAVVPSSSHNDGWYWGGGLEMLVSHGFVVGVEYRHYDFKSSFQGSTPGSPATDKNVKADVEAVLLRLTIKQ